MSRSATSRPEKGIIRTPSPFPPLGADETRAATSPDAGLVILVLPWRPVDDAVPAHVCTSASDDPREQALSQAVRPTGQRNTRHIFVTGGVASSLGKGLTASSLGQLLTARGLRVGSAHGLEVPHRAVALGEPIEIGGVEQLAGAGAVALRGLDAEPGGRLDAGQVGRPGAAARHRGQGE